MKTKLLSIPLTATIMLLTAAPAPAAITGSVDADRLAGAVIGTPVSGAAFVGATGTSTPDTYPAAIGDSPLAGFPTAGAEYSVLSSGIARFADDPNTSGASGYEHYFHAPFGGDAYDPVRLAIPVSVPAGSTCLEADYRFLSEEYPERVGIPENDGFVLELDRSSWSVQQIGPNEATVSAPDDFAAPAGQEFVGASTVAMSDTEAAGTTFDGASALLTARTPISPGTHTVYASVFDVDGYSIDSAVFIDNLRATSDPACAGPPPSQGGPGGGSGGGPGASGGRASTGRPRVTPGGMRIGTVCTTNPADVAEHLPYCGGTVDAYGRFVPKPQGAVRPRRGREPQGPIHLGSVSYSFAAGETAELSILFDRSLRPLVRGSRRIGVRLVVTSALDGAVEESRYRVKPKPPPG